MFFNNSIISILNNYQNSSTAGLSLIELSLFLLTYNGLSLQLRFADREMLPLARESS